MALAIAVATVAAFVLSSVYYTATTPLERRMLSDRALDRGRPAPWKIITELLRTALVAAAFAWLADQTQLTALPGLVLLAVVLWAAFPVMLLTGSIMWERVPTITAAVHTGDWLLKLLLIALIIGLLT